MKHSFLPSFTFPKTLSPHICITLEEIWTCFSHSASINTHLIGTVLVELIHNYASSESEKFWIKNKIKPKQKPTMKCSSSLHLLLSDILKTRTVLFTHSIHSTKQARSRHTWYIPTLHTSVPDCVYPLLILVPFLHLVQSPPLEDYFFLNEDSGQLLDIQMILTIMLRS